MLERGKRLGRLQERIPKDQAVGALGEDAAAQPVDLTLALKPPRDGRYAGAGC